MMLNKCVSRSLEHQQLREKYPCGSQLAVVTMSYKLRDRELFFKLPLDEPKMLLINMFKLKKNSCMEIYTSKIDNHR